MTVTEPPLVFGISGILTSSAANRLAIGAECSTPFGIIGILTRCGSAERRARDRAQRFSASLEFSHNLRSGLQSCLESKTRLRTDSCRLCATQALRTSGSMIAGIQQLRR